jgi:hypothetical protein
MIAKGWIYCSGMISDCPPGVPIKGAEYYSCRHHSTNPHWHRVFETEEGHAFIDWDAFVVDPDRPPVGLNLG